MLSGYAPSVIGFRLQLLAEMVNRGHRVHVCAPDFTEEDAATLRAIGITVHSISLQRTGLHPFRDALYVSRVTRLCRRIGADDCIAYMVKPVTLGLQGARFAGVKRRFALVTGLGYGFSAEAGWVGLLVRRMYRAALAGAAHVFFQNPDDAALFQSSGLVSRESPVTVVNGSGVDLDKFAVAPIPRGPLSFLMICRLLGDKGVREYARAAAELHREYPSVDFRLAGWLDTNPSGISESELRDWQKDGSVKFIGRLADVRAAIAAATVFVLPSYREGTPRTVLEAMAMGRPIITTDVPGCKETVLDGVNGYLVPVKSAEALREAMRRFILDPALTVRMGLASREIVEAKYNVHDVNNLMLARMSL